MSSSTASERKFRSFVQSQYNVLRTDAAPEVLQAKLDERFKTLREQEERRKRLPRNYLKDVAMAYNNNTSGVGDNLSDDTSGESDENESDGEGEEADNDEGLLPSDIAPEHVANTLNRVHGHGYVFRTYITLVSEKMEGFWQDAKNRYTPRVKKQAVIPDVRSASTTFNAIVHTDLNPNDRKQVVSLLEESQPALSGTVAALSLFARKATLDVSTVI